MHVCGLNFVSLKPFVTVFKKNDPSKLHGFTQPLLKMKYYIYKKLLLMLN